MRTGKFCESVSHSNSNFGFTDFYSEISFQEMLSFHISLCLPHVFFFFFSQVFADLTLDSKKMIGSFSLFLFFFFLFSLPSLPPSFPPFLQFFFFFFKERVYVLRIPMASLSYLTQPDKCQDGSINSLMTWDLHCFHFL